jgi:RNA polymerase sigma factor (sigma-70 family)
LASKCVAQNVSSTPPEISVDFQFFCCLIGSISTSEAYRDEAQGRAQFNTTHWSVVLLAGEVQNPEADAALESLCRCYWYPLYAYIRRKGYSQHDAQDLTQDFFARLLERNYVRLAKAERGRFRSFLLKSLSHFLVNDWVRRQAQKRGNGQRLVSIQEQDAEERYQQEPASGVSAETLYDRRWALAVVGTALTGLGSEYRSTGRGAVFESLKDYILAEASTELYTRIGDKLGMTHGAVKVALHRLRGRFRELVRAEVAQTVPTPDEVDEELHCLIAALNAGSSGGS